MTHIAIIQALPDYTRRHLCHALADAYAGGAIKSGHEIRLIDVAAVDVPLLRSPEDHLHGDMPSILDGAWSDIVWAEHLVFVFPLWLGTMPALLRAFLEQVARWSLTHGLRGLERSILKFVGIAPCGEGLFELMEGATEQGRAGWFAEMGRLGAMVR